MTVPVTGILEKMDALVMKGALTLYGDNQKTCLVQSHTALPPRVEGGVPRLGPPMPVTKDHILALFKGLDRVPQDRFVLPANVLCWEANMLAWWRPAGKRRIFFKAQNDALNALSGTEVMHPPLVFRVRSGEIAVWALKEDERPLGDTTLCRAPYFNVYDSGNMCIGNVPLPASPRPDQIALWEECFFGSNFAHGNAQGVTSHPKGHTGYWVALGKGNATKTYAMKYLKQLPLTVMGAMKGVPDERNY